jgi:RimJ/RimL family protein N-acetyltransferase
MSGLQIETPRLLLRPFREDDLDDLARLNADAKLMRYIGSGVTLDRNATWRQIATFLGHEFLRGYSILAIEDRATGKLLGRSGPWFPLGWPMLEVGWLVDQAHQGRGIATEAGRWTLDWCFGSLGVTQACSIIHPANVASARVAEKLGGRHVGQVDDPAVFGKPVDLWLHEAPDR